MLVYGLDLWYYLTVITFAKQQWGENRLSNLSDIVYPCFSIVTVKPFYVQCLFYCSVIVLSPFVSLSQWGSLTNLMLNQCIYDT